MPRVFFFLLSTLLVLVTACSKTNESKTPNSTPLDAVNPANTIVAQDITHKQPETADIHTNITTLSPQAVKYLQVSPEMPKVGDTITIKPVFDTPEAEIPLKYQWEVNNTPIPETTSSLKLAGGFKRGDKIKCTVSYKEQKWFVTAEVFNSPPVFVGEPIVKRLNENKFTITAKAVDPDGDAVTYSLKPPLPNAVLDAHTGIITLDVSASKQGSINFTISASDGYGGEGLYNMTLSLQ